MGIAVLALLAPDIQTVLPYFRSEDHQDRFGKQEETKEEKHWDQQLHTLTTSVLKRVTPPQLNFRENDEVKAVPTFLGVTMLPNGNLLALAS